MSVSKVIKHEALHIGREIRQGNALAKVRTRHCFNMLPETLRVIRVLARSGPLS